jgi:hypothetical protein
MKPGDFLRVRQQSSSTAVYRIIQVVEKAMRQETTLETDKPVEFIHFLTGQQ